ncbi:hypothetical protein LTR84_002080 [Exophiala bonariae]|uniref:CENP-V/GFA domain-containing protein n=1 Tax=Exophiala bonariae TaxID=1690606 RepID=A0AAV9NBJ9_9EURO|nr:hypothetical protein LTR84_002080 [Exophiala bonariae]
MSTTQPHQQEPHQFPLSTAQLSCLCGTVKEPGTLLVPSGQSKTFPVASHMCHCNSCRYVTGNILLSGPALTTSPSRASLAHCTAYATSAQFVRYFCTTCGCHCFTQNMAIARKELDVTTDPSSASSCPDEAKIESDDEEPEWYTNSGLIERDPAQIEADAPWATDLVNTLSHMFIADTLDGGIVPRLSNPASTKIPLFMDGYSDEATSPGSATSLESVLQLRLNNSKSTSPSSTASSSCLKAACHCGSVKLSIRRPDYAVDTQGVPARYIAEHATTKYPAWFCACRSDRTGNGAWFAQPWTYIPPANITFTFPVDDDDDPEGDERQVTVADVFQLSSSSSSPPNLPSGSPSTATATAKEAVSARLSQHRSSTSTTRSFCRTCGATVFYMHDERPSVVNVAVGILRADDGALASDWLDWVPGRVVCPEETTERTLLRALLG